jgi:hypothetical protein
VKTGIPRPGVVTSGYEERRRSLLKKLLGFKNTAITVGAAFFISGIIKLAVRGTTDVDIFVGAAFLVFGIVISLAGKKSPE